MNLELSNVSRLCGVASWNKGAITGFISLLICATVGAITPPILEDFEGGLPGDSYWTFNSSTEGRIQVVLEEYTHQVEDAGATPVDYGPYANRIRGNYYACDRAATLERQGIYVERPAGLWIYFSVYESVTQGGTYSRISYDYTWAPTGSNTVYSPIVDIPLEEGKFYAIVAGWTSAATYQAQGNHVPALAVSFGETFGGVNYNESGVPPATLSGLATSCYRQELDVYYDDVLRMDDSVNLSLYSTNTATLTVNLLNYDSAVLKFSHRESADESGIDGIYLSTNGTDYAYIYNVDVADTDWHDVEIDLAQAAADNGMELSAATRIQFLQYDNYSWDGNDGREFDDIVVYSEPDLMLDGINSSGSTLPTFIWKGFSSTRTIPITQPVYKRGGMNDLPSTSIGMNYRLVDYLSNDEMDDGTYSFSMSIPALSQSTSNYDGTQYVPGSTVFSNLLYVMNSTVDYYEAVAEGSESNNTDALLLFVNHYSGKLWFDGIETDITVTDFSAPGFSSTEHVIDGYGTLNGFSFNFTDLEVIKDQTTLDYTIDPTSTDTIVVNTPGIDSVSNVRFDRPSGVTLSRMGVHGDVRAWLPTGLGIDTTPSYVMAATVTFGGKPELSQQLYPVSTVTRAGPFYISEETKPLHFYVQDVSWNASSGEFIFRKDDVSFVRGDDLDWLETNKPNLIDPAMVTKRSNAQHYRSVAAVTDNITVAAGSDYDARLSARIVLNSGNFKPHFPYGPDYTWDTSSEMIFRDDLVDPRTELKDVHDVDISYALSVDETDCASTDPAEVVTGMAVGHALFNKDGGIRQVVGLKDVDIHWGKHVNGRYAQEALQFVDGTYYMPGHFIRGDQSRLNISENFGPAVIMLSGTLPDNVWEMERPGHYSGAQDYRNGFADYAGINLRCVNDSAHEGKCTLGGTGTDPWPLTGRSKYYLRPSGVSGIQEAVYGKFPETLEIYKYIHDFDNFGLSYLSNEQEESRINGLVQLPQPSNFDVEYEELTLNPVGELLSAEVGSAPEKTMAYWDAVIDPATLFYAPTELTDCSNNERVLCLGVTSHCANIENMLAGVLGFLANGQIASMVDGVIGVDSRLSVGNNVKLDGPADEIYTFTPMVNPYYNTEDIAGGSRGWINMAGTIDVAFFSDLQVLFHTSASTNSTAAPIYMMGGFDDQDGGHNFIDNPKEFDDRNAGYPSHLVGSVDDYRNPTDDTYRVRAQRNWLSVINFDYPLDWSTASKSFKSPETLTSDLMVIDVEHQTDYLSAENAEISFGLQYEGLPQVNIANMAFNAIDESTGMAEAFVNGVGDKVVDTIAGGLGEFDDLLADIPEQLFDPLLDETLDPLIDTLYTALSSAYNPADPYVDYYSVAVSNYLFGGAGVPDTVLDRFDELIDGAAAANNLLNDINDSLDKVTRTIDAFTGTVSIDPVSGTNLAQSINGLLNLEGSQFAVLGELASSIVGELAADLANQLAGELEPKINEFLGQVQPALESAGEYMDQVKAVVEEAQTQLGSGLSFAEELREAMAANPLELAMGGAYSNLVERFNNLTAAANLFEEYTEAEIKAMIRQEIDDAFYGSLACCDIQQVLRSRLYDVDASLREAIDSVFQQLNKAIRDLVSEFVAGIDDEINGMLDSLSDVIGSGQIDGYAHIKGDSLTELRLDGKFKWEVPDDMEFNAYMIYRQLDSDGSASCGLPGGQAAEVVLGSEDVDLSWTGTDIRAAIMTKFAFQTAPDFAILGLAGSFEMTEGEIGFESFTINELYAAVAFGATENYLSAAVGCQMSSFEVSGGVFFGRACSLDPFAWDPDVQNILGDPPFTGIYVYGEGWMPIVSYGCLFQIKAGAGAGIFAFLEGPVGGKVFLGAEGEALCVVTIRGEVTLVGMKNGDILRMKGKGKISGKLGSCPFCVKFNKSVEVTYENGSWDADY